MKSATNLSSKFDSFLFGLSLPWLSLKVILKSKKLILLSIIPIIITLLLYFYLFNYINAMSYEKLNLLLTRWGVDSTRWFAKLAFFLIKLIVFVMGVLTFSFAASLAACPFNDLLAEHTEAYTQPQLPALQSPSFTFRIRLIFIDLYKTLFAILVAGIIFIASLIPAINIASSLLGFLMITFQFLSYPQTRRGSGIRGDLGFIFENLFACFGFGIISAFLLSIPFVSCFLFPVSVVGGTLLFGHLHAQSRSTSSLGS